MIHSIQSEWLKTRRSLASWLVVIGGLFIPLIFLYDRLRHFSTMAENNAKPGIWTYYFKQCWQYMSILLLPLGIILTVSLITQIEYRNNTWKQVHTTPQRLSTIFLAKLVVILTMLLQFFLIFNGGIWLIVALPSVFGTVDYPSAPIPLDTFGEFNHRFWVGSLPIVGLQYLLSLHFRNFMVPLGVGLAIFVATIIGLKWEYGYLIPYSYLSYFFMNNTQHLLDQGINIYYCALGYFAVFTGLAWLSYRYQRSKN